MSFSSTNPPNSSQSAMSEADKQEAPAEQVKRKPTGDYDVGYCRPPVQHRFKPGNNANPKGRRKGTKNRKVVVRDVLLEQITVREGDEIKQMSKFEAVLKKTLSQALGGDKKSAVTIFAIAQKDGLLTPEQEQAVENLSENDAAIIEDYNRRLGVHDSEQANEQMPLPDEPPGRAPSSRH